MKLYSINLNNTMYTFIEILEFDNKNYLHFAVDNKSVFLEYDGKNNIKLASDEVKEALLKKHYPYDTRILFLNMDYIKSLVFGPKVYEHTINQIPISEEDKIKIIEEYLSDIAKYNLPLDTIRKRLMSFNFYNGHYNAVNPVIAGGVTNHVDNSVTFNVNDTHVIHHELTHISQGWHKNFFLGFVEGQTELETVRTLGLENYSIPYLNHFKINIYGHYIVQQCILKQMEYLLNQSVVSDAILGTDNFYTNFANMYGKDLLTFLGKRSTRLINYDGSSFRDEEECIAYFRETQQVLLERVFDLKFKNVNSLRSAEAYLDKLLNFQLYRAREKNDPLVEYYNKKLNDILIFLRKNGVSEEKIQDFMIRHEFKELDFYPTYIDPKIRKKYEDMGLVILPNGNIVPKEQEVVKSSTLGSINIFSLILMTIFMEIVISLVVLYFTRKMKNKFFII